MLLLLLLLLLLLSALPICCLGICTEQHAEQREPHAVSGVSARHASHTCAWPVTHMFGPDTSCDTRRIRAAIDW